MKRGQLPGHVLECVLIEPSTALMVQNIKSVNPIGRKLKSTVPGCRRVTVSRLAGQTMNTYSTSAVSTRSTEDVLQAALATLTNNGFAIVNRDENTAELTGPGLNSTKQNPLLGASRIKLRLQDQQLCLNAELGGVDSMRRFLMRFPFLPGLGLGLLFGIIGGLTFRRQFGVGFGVPWAQGLAWMLFAIGGAIPVTPWLFFSPVLSNMIRTRTQTALTTLVQNAVQMPESA